MNYDGPSFYKKRELDNSVESSHELETPLDRLRKVKDLRNQLNKETLSKQNRNTAYTGSHYFRSKQIPKSLQKRAAWKKESWDQELLNNLEKRLKKDSADYLLFSDNLNENMIEEDVKGHKEKEQYDTSPEAISIKKMVDEIESTLDTVALVQHKMKPDLTKPNTGLHRTLSNIVVEDKARFKNKK